MCTAIKPWAESCLHSCSASAASISALPSTHAHASCSKRVLRHRNRFLFFVFYASGRQGVTRKVSTNNIVRRIQPYCGPFQVAALRAHVGTAEHKEYLMRRRCFRNWLVFVMNIPVSRAFARWRCAVSYCREHGSPVYRAMLKTCRR